MWRGAWSGRHGGDTVSTRAILDAIGPDENRTVQRLLQTVPAREPGEDEATPVFNFRKARSKLETLALLSLAPRVLRTGTPIEPTSVTGPDSIVALDMTGELATTLAARLVHPRTARLREAIARASDALRATHGISKAAHEALVRGDDDGFLRARAAQLRDVVRRFQHPRAKWGENDRPPISGLHVGDEE